MKCQAILQFIFGKISNSQNTTLLLIAVDVFGKPITPKASIVVNAKLLVQFI